ncbi:MAG TPA: class I SAM-dependent methyltransferase [Candidatus Binatia bacterium]|jgi:2-polyprenyl-3-methyl-5-hydroxy-6-metoxy-1,4-benzoquinol methylase|nr:class I SAM-dependent methyltransferase [Candidatus Binatia bacterium]
MATLQADTTSEQLTYPGLREWNPKQFDAVYDQFVARDEIAFGDRQYYLRYRSRYKLCIERFAQLMPPNQRNVLDIGGGQLAMICMKLWGDRGTVVDLPGPHLDYMARHGVDIKVWNLCEEDAPFSDRFDFIFMSEVIEHIPIPGYIVLERLRKLLKPGGVLLCTTPNLYRIRNMIYMITGHQIFDHFQYPDRHISLSHVIEYSREHLEWQFQRAGFSRCKVELVEMHHSVNNPFLRPLGWLRYPLYAVPRWRANLIATAYAPAPDDAMASREPWDVSQLCCSS